MTYEELLKTTAKNKRKAIAELNTVLNGNGGWLIREDIEKNSGKYAWTMLAREFCETLAQHVGEFIEQAGDVDSPEAREIGAIYMAYEDDDPELYEMLPTEAKLFEEWEVSR